jgi:flagellar FliL protein
LGEKFHRDQEGPVAQQADNPAQALPQARRSKKWMVIGVLALLLAVGAGGAAWFMLKSGGSGDVEGEAASTASTAATTLFFTLDPPFVVNFELPSPVRFLQVTVELELQQQADLDAVQKHLPVIRNNLLMLFSGQDYQHLRNRSGKEQLREAVLAEVRSILAERAKRDGVTQVYFTHFVMQ